MSNGVNIIRNGVRLPDIHSGNTEIWRISLRRAVMRKDGRWFLVRRLFPGDHDGGTSIDTMEETTVEIAKRVIENPETVE